MMVPTSIVTSSRRPQQNKYSEFNLLEETSIPSLEAVYCKTRPDAPHRFTTQLLEEYELFFGKLRSWNSGTENSDLRFCVFESGIPGIFNLGGDLPLFLHAIRSRDERLLTNYANRCIQLIYTIGNSTYQSQSTSIALVQGTALGGGFEAALAADHIIAEESAVFGFPELVFGMFPGMGALQLLMRRVPQVPARRIIETARTYRAKELYELGVIDRVVPNGMGRAAVEDLIRSKRRQGQGYHALSAITTMCAPLDHGMLSEVGAKWVETAMQLSRSQLTMMERLYQAQGGNKVPSTVPRAA